MEMRLCVGKEMDGPVEIEIAADDAAEEAAAEIVGANTGMGYLVNDIDTQYRLCRLFHNMSYGFADHLA